ncbi:hypothetical protein [Paenibacillus eucommiae]|uniref:Uncharacterized protein n=1 Tax=Paenibacillus eucommiae TaxID=1355755 RepID=A0ABS4J876_9BACL|nr:hypothetical protein [Paenibacillus eucommiae]MBP1996048.1 hypothetical protein [Paenibacillus eucommiae]
MFITKSIRRNKTGHESRKKADRGSFRWAGIGFALALFLSLAASCDEKAKPPAVSSSPNQESGLHHLSPSPSLLPVSSASGSGSGQETAKSEFSAAMNELSLCQQNPPPPNQEGLGDSDCFAFYGTIPDSGSPIKPFPDQPATYALYMTDAYFFVNFESKDAATLERLAAQIHVEGGKLNFVKENPELSASRYKGVITQIGSRAVLTVGDLPPITLIRSDNRLSFTASSNGKDGELLMANGREFGTQIFVSSTEREVLLTFSEPVLASQVTASGNGSDAPKPWGKWQNESSLLLPLPEGKDVWNISLSSLLAKSGNYMNQFDQYVSIHKIPERQWLQYPSGAQVTDSRYAKFYDFPLLSPNKKNTIGLIQLGGPFADEPGGYYALVLDREGQKPTIIESVVHFPGDLQNMPVQWIGNDAVVWMTYTNWMKLDLNTGKLTSFKDDDAPAGYFNGSAYDGPTDTQPNISVKNQ